jgi:hypothetical protein
MAEHWRLTAGEPVPVSGGFTATAEGLDVQGEYVTMLVHITAPHAADLVAVFDDAMRKWSDGPARQGVPAPPQPLERVLPHLRAEVLTTDQTWHNWDTRQAGGTGTDWEIRFRFARDRLPQGLSEVIVRLSAGSEETVHVWSRAAAE